MYATLLKQALRIDADSLSSLSDQGRGGGGSRSYEDGSSDVSALNQLAAIYERYGREDEVMQTALNGEVNMCLFESIKLFMSGNFQQPHKKLADMHKAVSEYSTRLAAPHMLFALNRMQALGHYLEGRLELAVAHSNECIARCPRFNGSHAPGLADTLMLLSEMYEQLGYSEDALHAARLCVDVALNRLEAFEKDVPRDMLGLGAQGLPRCLGPALDEYTAMTAAYHNLAKRLASRGMDGLAVEWIERALNTATKFGLDRPYLQELTNDLQASREAAAAGGVSPPRIALPLHPREPPTEITVNYSFLNGDVGSLISMSPTSHFTSFPQMDSARKRMEGEDDFAPAEDVYVDEGSHPAQLQLPGLRAGLDINRPAFGDASLERVGPGSNWLLPFAAEEEAHVSAERPRGGGRARPKSAMPHPTSAYRPPANPGADHVGASAYLSDTPPTGRGGMHIHTALLDAAAEEVGAGPSSRSRPKSAVSKLGGGYYTPSGASLGHSNDPEASGFEPAFDAAGRPDKGREDGSKRAAAGRFFSEHEHDYRAADPRRESKLHAHSLGGAHKLAHVAHDDAYTNRAAHVAGVVTAGMRDMAAELHDARGGIVMFFGNNSSKAAAATRSRPSSSGAARGGAKASVNNMSAVRKDIAAAGLFTAAALATQPQIPATAAAAATAMFTGGPETAQRGGGSSSNKRRHAPAASLLDGGRDLSAKDLLDLVEDATNDTDMQAEHAAAAAAKARRSPPEGRQTSAANERLQTGPIFQEAEAARAKAQAENKIRIHKRTEKAKRRTVKALEEERRELQIERMRVAADQERREEALEIERRRLDAARLELARLHEARMSSILKERDAAMQQVDALARELESERITTSETVRREREHGEKSVKKERMKLELELAERLRGEMDTLKRADEARASLFLQQQQELAALLKPFHVGMAVEVEIALDERLAANIGEDRSNTWRAALVTNTLPGLVFEVQYTDGDAGVELVPFSRLRRPVLNAVATVAAVSVSVPAPVEEQKSKDRVEETAEREEEESAPDHAEQFVSPEPSAPEPEPIPVVTRAQLNQQLQEHLSQVRARAAGTSHIRANDRSSTRNRAATAIQRIARGVCVRGDVQLRRQLARAHNLRLRERQLEAERKELSRQTTDARLLASTNSLLQRQHEEMMRSLQDMRNVEGQLALKASASSDRALSFVGAPEAKAEVAVTRALTVSNSAAVPALSAPASAPSPLRVHVPTPVAAQTRAPAPAAAAAPIPAASGVNTSSQRKGGSEAEALEAIEAIVDLGDSDDRLSVFTEGSSTVYAREKEARSQTAQIDAGSNEGKSIEQQKSNTPGQNRRAGGSGRAPSPPRPFSRAAQKPRSPRPTNEAYIPSDAALHQQAIVDKLEENFDEGWQLEELCSAYVRLSNIFYHEGAIKEAVVAREQALQVFPAASAEVVVGILNFLIRMAGELGDNAAVEGYYRRAVEVKYALPTTVVAVKRSPAVLGTAKAADKREKYRPSAKVHNDEVAIDRIKSAKGQDMNAKLLAAYLQIASSYRREGGNAEATQAYQNALAILLDTGIHNNPVAAVQTLGALGVFARCSGQIDQARAYFSDMIIAGQKVAQMASKNPATLKDNNRVITEFALYTVHFADLYRLSGDYRRAAALLEDACHVLETNLDRNHPATSLARRCLQYAEQGITYSVREFELLTPDALESQNTADSLRNSSTHTNVAAAKAVEPPGVEVTDPSYAHKAAALQQILVLVANHPKEMAGLRQMEEEAHAKVSTESKANESQAAGLRAPSPFSLLSQLPSWRRKMMEFSTDLNALRSKVCHLLDPLSAVAVTVFTVDRDLNVSIYRGKAQDPASVSHINRKALAPEMIGPILDNTAPVRGTGPTDTDWPETSMALHPNSEGVGLEVPSVGSLSNGSTLFRSVFESEANAYFEPHGDNSSDSDLGRRMIFSVPLFSLHESSLVGNSGGGASKHSIESAAAAPICIDVVLGAGGEPKSDDIRGENPSAMAVPGWTLSLPEATLTRLAASGEWISFRLRDSPEAPPRERSLWMRSSMIIIGNVLDRFSQLWAVHVAWATQHILTTAALEDLLCDSIKQGIEMTMKAPGGGLLTYELDGYEARPQRGLLPSRPSGSALVKHLHHTAHGHYHRGGASHSLSPEGSLASGFSKELLDTTEHEPSHSAHVADDGLLEADSRVAELEHVLLTGRRRYAACQADVTRAQLGLRRALRKWELDPRRQRDMMTPTTEDGTLDEEEAPLKPRTSTENVVSRRLGVASATIYRALSEASITHGHAGKGGGKGGGLELGKSSWEDVRTSLWAQVEAPLLTCLEEMFEGVGLQVPAGTFTRPEHEVEDLLAVGKNLPLHVRNIACVACQIALYAAVDQIMTFNWKSWHKHASRWSEMIPQAKLEAIVDECEKLMYAPVPAAALRDLMDSANIVGLGVGDPINDTAVLTQAELDIEKARAAAINAIPPIRFHHESPTIRLMQEAVQSQIHDKRDPREIMQLRAHGALETCAHQ